MEIGPNDGVRYESPEVLIIYCMYQISWRFIQKLSTYLTKFNSAFNMVSLLLGKRSFKADNVKKVSKFSTLNRHAVNKTFSKF